MPKQKINEDLEIVIFTTKEMEQLDQYFHNTNGETAYLLGKYCGLRINECYGLKWQNVDLEKGCFVIDRQMQYQNGLIKLVPVKTKNARRTIYMASPLKEYFQRLKQQQEEATINLAPLRQQNQTMITDLDGKQISCLELVNCLPNGKIQTVNSMKYHAQEIKRTLGIHFNYHYLRHTYGTRLAELNTPTHLLCNQMGHANMKVTQQYYIAVSQRGVDNLLTLLQQL